MKPLSLKQQAFARHRFSGLTQSAAAKAAGYSGTDHSLEKRGSQLEANPRVQQEITRLRKAAEDHTILTKRESLQFLTRIVKFSLADVCDQYGNLDIIKARDKKVLDLIERYTVEPMTYQGESLGNKIVIRSCSKLTAIAQLSAELGWDAPIKQHLEIEKKIDLSNMSVPQLFERCRELAAKLSPRKEPKP